MLHLKLFGQDEQQLRYILSEADSLIALRQLPSAMEKINQAMQIDPSDASALSKQINIFYLMDENKEALKLADQAINSYPGVSEFYYLRATINNAQQRYSRAISDFEQALSLQNDDMIYKIYLGRGISYMNLAEYERAMTDLTKSIELNDTIAAAYSGRAMLHYQLKDYESSVNDFLSSIRYSEENASLYFNLGMAYFRLNDTANACPWFHKACTLGNNNACRMALMECAKSIPNLP